MFNRKDRPLGGPQHRGRSAHRATRGSGEGPGRGRRGGPHGRMRGGRHRLAEDGLFSDGSDDFGGLGRGGSGRGFGGHGGRRRGRAMDGAGLQLLLLSLTSVEPRHGYELIRAIEEMSEGHYVPSPGMVYPALAFLEDAGLIAVATTDGARKSFLATEAGRERLTAEAAVLAQVEARLAALAGQAKAEDGVAAVQPVRRAMHNLRAVLMARLQAGDIPVEMQHRIVDIIDDAARQIERMV